MADGPILLKIWWPDGTRPPNMVGAPTLYSYHKNGLAKTVCEAVFMIQISAVFGVFSEGGYIFRPC